ncbi:MAG: hypothetical protein J6I40_07765, partial [Mailhella sp.]|nr:hypothetical protein [Mailhella sp.]
MTEQKSGSFLWIRASSPEEKEEVYRFRYAQYFAEKGDLPGVDHVHKRVFLPHDEYSVHVAVRDNHGNLLAVGTATPANVRCIIPEWQCMFDLAKLSPVSKDLVLISRVIVENSARLSPLFGQMSMHLASIGIENGFSYAAHYCAPCKIALYERLGYRCYGLGHSLGHFFRIPMIFAIDATDYLQRLRSPLSRLSGKRQANSEKVDSLLKLFPELSELPLCALSTEQRLQRLKRFCPGIASAGNTLLQALMKAGIFRLPAGAILARNGQNEGSFFLLQGSIR